jgi:levanase/fructan beta-fructosidase
MDAPGGKLTLQLLLDRTTIEAFGDAGRISMSSCFLPEPNNKSMSIFTNGASIAITKLEVHHLKSSW